MQGNEHLLPNLQQPAGQLLEQSCSPSVCPSDGESAQPLTWKASPFIGTGDPGGATPVELGNDW